MKIDSSPDTTRRSLLQGSAAAALTLHFSLLPAMIQAASKISASLKKNPQLESWIRIDEAGQVSIFTGKAELGQGIGTALVQIASDELDVAPARVILITPDTEISPDEGYTYSSISVQQSGMAIRQASASARQMLLKWAAGRWHTTAGRLTVTDGVVRFGAKEITYGALVAEKGPVQGRVAVDVLPKVPGDRRLCGRGFNRIDIPAKIFAEGAYIHDLRLPGMRHARMVRPPSYAASLKSLDRAMASAMPGVEKIIEDGSFLAVIAKREEQAIAAAEILGQAAIWSDGDEFPDEKNLATFVYQHPGAQSKVIAESGQNVEHTGATELNARYTRPFQAHAPVGPSLGLAEWKDGHLRVWTHSQGIYPLRREIAAVLSLPEEKIRIIHRDGSGCYGHNAADDAALEAAIVAMRMPGIPVRLQWMRGEEFRWEPYGPAMVMEAAAALDSNGRIVDWTYGVWGFPHSNRPFGSGGRLLAVRYLAQKRPLTMPRQIPQPRGGLDRNALPYYDFLRQKVTKNFIANSPLRTSSLRSLGTYGNIFAIESFMDELAHQSGQDPVRFRLKHLSDPRAVAVIRKLAELTDWQAGTVNSEDRGQGRGFAFARYKNSGGYLAVCVDLSVDADTGEVTLKDIYAAVDCGEVINPDGIRNQVEGGILQAASWSLYEQVSFDGNNILAEDWISYPILTYDHIPRLHIHLMDMPDMPPLGAGEVAQGPMPAAIANALFSATARRLRSLPFTPEKILNA